MTKQQNTDLLGVQTKTEKENIVAKHREDIKIEILRSIADSVLSIGRIEHAKKELAEEELEQSNLRHREYTDVVLLGKFTSLITSLAAAAKLSLLDAQAAERVRLPTAFAMQYVLIDADLAVECVEDNGSKWRIESRSSPALNGEIIYELYRDEMLVNMRESSDLLSTTLVNNKWSVKF